MAGPQLSSAPVLSTPESHIFEDPSQTITVSSLPRLSDEQLYVSFEIERTIKEIKDGKWRRIALQFPDDMLPHAPRVYRALSRGLVQLNLPSEVPPTDGTVVSNDMERLGVQDHNDADIKISILGDTSYGACCVDEVAAEHVDAEVVVHYGRSCLSPISRLPVIYVFTVRPLDMRATIKAFKEMYPLQNEKVVLMADIPFSTHITELKRMLLEEGYTDIFATSVIHDPSSQLPNRTVPEKVITSPELLRDYSLFHIGQPPPALLLTLASRIGSVHIHAADSESNQNRPLLASTTQALRRRYALVASLSSVSVFGILINTLSVKNYLHIVEHVKSRIAAAGKKSYTFVVGKINAAKIANFSEIGGWVVIGCWESSLVESKDFYRPLITPFELELVLKGDKNRIWTGEWSSDFESVLKDTAEADENIVDLNGKAEADDEGSEDESAPPEFDLRTGRYVAQPRLRSMNGAKPSMKTESGSAHGILQASSAVIKRANGELAQIGGVLSPGAEFLRSNRTWQGLGSDFEIDFTDAQAGAVMEEGRSGIARGYTMGAKPEG